jgi:hypothetical protein
MNAIDDSDKVRRALLLAAIDMEQVIAAAGMLDEQTRRLDRPENHHQAVRALETAIACCYYRPLRGVRGRDSYVVPTEHVEPSDPELAELHGRLLRYRNKAYAHTDRTEALRDATWTTTEWSEKWVAWISPHDVPTIVRLAEYQRDRFRSLAREIGGTPPALRPVIDHTIVATYAATPVLEPPG